MERYGLRASKVDNTPLWTYTTAGGMQINSISVSSDGSYIAANALEASVKTAKAGVAVEAK